MPARHVGELIEGPQSAEVDHLLQAAAHLHAESTITGTPARASSRPSIMPAGPPPAMQQRTDPIPGF